MIYIWSVLHLFEETLLLGLFPLTFSFATYSRDFKLNTFTTVYSFLDHPTFSTKAQGPIYNLGPHPYNSSSKLRFFFLSSEEKKWGFDFLRVKTTYSSDLHTWEHRFAHPIIVMTLWSSRCIINCSRWRFVPRIQRWGADPAVDISLRILSRITSTQFLLLYKAPEGLIFSHFTRTLNS